MVEHVHLRARPSDIVVVGAGVVGCAVAYELARRGASVQIVDGRRPVGMGATQAAAGVLAPYIEGGEGNSVFLDLAVRSLHLYDSFISEVASDSGVAIRYHRTGTLEVTTSDDRMTSLRNIAARLEAQGLPLHLFDGQAARAEEACLSGDVVGGLLISAHGFVGASDLTRALAAAARRHGAQLVEGSHVQRIVEVHGDLVVETGRGPLTGNAVVLAAGSWSGQIEIVGLGASIPVRPVRGQLLQVMWNGPPLRRVIWGERCYLVPWDDGTLLVGATVEEAGFDERTTVAGVRDLLDAACDLVPSAWTAGFLGARAGLRPASADHLPIIGASQVLPNLMYATGHYRNGVLLAPLTAQLVADAMLDNRIDPALEATSPRRFGRL
jgi:glycine oxidase